MTDDPLTQTRLDVAEMKGMLTQALSDQGTRLTNLEKDNNLLHGRVSDKGKLLATQGEKILSLEKAVNVIENDNRARHARVIGVISAAISAAALALAILNRLTLI